MSEIEIKVPDIGDFDVVDVIEVLVKPGDVVALEDPLITLESDKATMDIPAPQPGEVVSILVSVGDRVGEGTVIITLRSAADAASTAVSESAPSASTTSNSKPSAS